MNTKSSISCSDLLVHIKNNNVQILDVRSAEEFNLGHISDAKNIPVDELAQRHFEVKNSKVIVTYCGKGGGRSEKAAGILSENGKQAVWLEGGYTEWQLL